MSGRRLALVGLMLSSLVSGAAPEPAVPPVSPAAAIQAALESNLKQVRQWLDDSDFASAAQAARGLTALAWLSSRQGDTPAWRRQTDTLRRVCAGLETAAARKDARAAAKAADSCAALLAELAKEKPGRPQTGAPALTGSTKSWMLLMEGAYVDSKSAAAPRDVERFARELAEEIRAVSRLRSDPRWRKMAHDVRTAALRAADVGRTQDLASARKAMKLVYHRCEACHQDRRP